MTSHQSESNLERVGRDGVSRAAIPHPRSSLRDEAGAAGFRRPGPLFHGLIALLLLIGFVARLAPFFDVDNRLYEQFVTEDGYFMLAIARNLGIGNGFAIADGEMPTNGTQPLTTLLFAVGYWLVDGAKKAGVAFAQALQFVAAMLATWFLYQLGRKAFAKRPEGPTIAALGAAAWFASPLALTHTANALETGVYAMIAVLVAWRFVESDDQAQAPWTIPSTLLSGILLGVAFWSRNDAAFLILAACLTYLYSGAHHGLSAVRARFGRALLFGATSVVVATPWLAFNYRLFGHIVPVSGRAESLTAEPFSNVLEVPPVLLEYFGVFIPIPQVYEDIPWFAAICIVPVLAIVGLVLTRWGRAHRTERSLILLVSIYGVCLSSFYGLYFGAGWFMARYLFPLSPFLALLWAAWAVRWLAPKIRGPILYALATGMVAVIVAQNYRWYRGGDQHPHFQVIEWADAHVPDSMWVGAIQTGTLGYFHDRTYNLDGKVNIDAYYATKTGRSGPYVVTTDIEYLLDWTGMADWLTKPSVAANFRVLVLDYERNLSVLQRRDRIRLGADLAFDHDAARIALRQLASALAKTDNGAAGERRRWALLYHVAWLQDALEDEDEARRSARNALALCQKNAGGDPWRRREVLTRRLLSSVLRAQHRVDEALEQMDRAHDLLAKTFSATTAAGRRDRALSLLELGERQWEAGELDAAKARFTEALSMQDELLQEGVGSVDRDRAVALLAIGDVAMANEEFDAAEGAFEASWAIRKRRYDADRSRQATNDLALAEARLGRLAFVTGDAATAETRIEKSISLRRSLPKVDPGQAEPPPPRAIAFADGLLGLSDQRLLPLEP